MKDIKYIICDSEENLNRALVGIVKMLTEDGKPLCIRVLNHNHDFCVSGKVNLHVDENIKRPDGQYLYNGTFVKREKVVRPFLKYSRAVEIYEIENVNAPIMWRTMEV